MEMPILSKSFFEKHTPDTGFFSKWQSFGKWSSVCLPVYHWQSALFIGCLELPDSTFFEEFQTQFPGIQAVPVMCDSDSLKSIWAMFQSSPPTSAGISLASLEVGAAPSLSTGGENKETTSFESMLADDGNDSAEGAAKAHGGDENSSEMLDLNFGFPSDTPPSSTPPPPLDLTGIKLSTPAHTAPPPPTVETNTAVAVAPANATAASKASVPPVAKAAGAAPAKPSVPPPASQKINPNFDMTQSGVHSNFGVTKTGVTKTAATAVTMVAPVADRQAPASQKPGFKTIPAMETPKKAVPTSAEILYTKPGALSSNKDLMEKTKTSWEAAAKNPNAPAGLKKGNFPDSVFSELNYHFQKTMILLVENESVRPWKWDAHFQTAPSPIEKINLKTPSAFRIVMKTQKPYHGYVVSNEITDKFFDDWNSSHTPEHLTVVPVLSKENVVAMILCIGEKSADNKTSLSLAEKVALEVSNQATTEPNLLKAS